MKQLDELKGRPVSELKQLPPYAEINSPIGDRSVRFETVVEPRDEGEFIVVKRAFIRSWSRPNWISLRSIGVMFADGFVVRANGAIEAAPDLMMWEFR